MSGAPTIVSDTTVRIGETTFSYGVPMPSTAPGELCIDKTRRLLETYFSMWDALAPKRVFEIGIKRGGSTAMLCELGGAERIVSVELTPSRVGDLDDFVVRRGVADIVHPHYGVDQADRSRLRTIVSDEFSDQPLDLVLDDASHLYAESLASFEVLYPHLRPGGLYVLEDWSWQHLVAAGLTEAMERNEGVRRDLEAQLVADGWTGPDTPMSRLVMELVIARAIAGDVVAEVSVGRDWVVVRRGPARLDPDRFRLAAHAPDHLELLTPLR